MLKLVIDIYVIIDLNWMNMWITTDVKWGLFIKWFKLMKENMYGKNKCNENIRSKENKV